MGRHALYCSAGLVAMSTLTLPSSGLAPACGLREALMSNVKLR